MKVFLSWSGARSRAIAEVLKGWLPSVLQAVKPYFSPEDTAKGSRWSAEIAKELEASRVALFIITPENQEAPWLLFEAGALSKDVDRSKVVPLLFAEMTPTDLKGPLVQFQAAQFSEEEMKRVLKSVNSELGDAALAPDVLDKVFEMWWPVLQAEVEKQVGTVAAGSRTARRSEREILEEVLALVRNFDARSDSRELPPALVDELLFSTLELASTATRLEPSDETMKSISRIYRALLYVVNQNARLRNRPKVKGLMNEFELLLVHLAESPSPAPLGKAADASGMLNIVRPLQEVAAVEDVG